MSSTDVFDKLVEITYALHTLVVKHRSYRSQRVVQAHCTMRPWRYERFGGGSDARPRNVVDIRTVLHLVDDTYVEWRIELHHDEGPVWTVASHAARGTYPVGTFSAVTAAVDTGSRHSVFHEEYHAFATRTASSDAELVAALDAARAAVVDHIKQMKRPDRAFSSTR